MLRDALERPSRILIIDDRIDDIKLLKAGLDGCGELAFATDGERAWRWRAACSRTWCCSTSNCPTCMASRSAAGSAPRRATPTAR
ncbi:hypothetical protein [Chitinimonas koreensis]|uniref:hypothetical protein n=1 Tax=Chitinimonas koreensis TaxID=356302 RepID=UPI0016541D41|nr:hypothetical protein [Chitinimonas koreensis]QNM95405.1 hypothetical protein H9L41_16235 [Chitinimonas koreensis]